MKLRRFELVHVGPSAHVLRAMRGDAIRSPRGTVPLSRPHSRGQSPLSGGDLDLKAAALTVAPDTRRPRWRSCRRASIELVPGGNPPGGLGAHKRPDRRAMRGVGAAPAGLLADGAVMEPSWARTRGSQRATSCGRRASTGAGRRARRAPQRSVRAVGERGTDRWSGNVPRTRSLTVLVMPCQYRSFLKWCRRCVRQIER